MKWEFVTRPVRGAGYVAWNWEWRAVADDGSIRTAARTFATFRECVADARAHGFSGDPDPSGFAPFFRAPLARFTWF
jgi:hypothetical protein